MAEGHLLLCRHPVGAGSKPALDTATKPGGRFGTCPYGGIIQRHFQYRRCGLQTRPVQAQNYQTHNDLEIRGSGKFFGTRWLGQRKNFLEI